MTFANCCEIARKLYQSAGVIIENLSIFRRRRRNRRDLGKMWGNQIFMICLSNILLPVACGKSKLQILPFRLHFRLPWHLDLCACRLKIQFNSHFFLPSRTLLLWDILCSFAYRLSYGSSGIVLAVSKFSFLWAHRFIGRAIFHEFNILS